MNTLEALQFAIDHPGVTVYPLGPDVCNIYYDDSINEFLNMKGEAVTLSYIIKGIHYPWKIQKLPLKENM